jgi:hypothetical protein
MKLYQLFESVVQRIDHSVSWKQGWHTNGVTNAPHFNFNPDTDTGFIGALFIPTHETIISDLPANIRNFCLTHEMKMDEIRSLIFFPDSMRDVFLQDHPDITDEDEMLEQMSEDAASAIIKIGSLMANENVLPRGLFYGSCPSTVGGLVKIINVLREKYNSVQAHHIHTSPEGVSVHASGYDAVEVNQSVFKKLLVQTFPFIKNVDEEYAYIINKFQRETSEPFKSTDGGVKLLITTGKNELYMVLSTGPLYFAKVFVDEENEITVEERSQAQMVDEIPDFVKLMQKSLFTGDVIATDSNGRTIPLQLEHGFHLYVPIFYATDAQLKQGAESVLNGLKSRKIKEQTVKDEIREQYANGQLDHFIQDDGDKYNPWKIITDEQMEEFLQFNPDLKEMLDTLTPPFELVDELREQGSDNNFGMSVIAVIEAENESNSYHHLYTDFKRAV